MHCFRFAYVMNAYQPTELKLTPQHIIEQGSEGPINKVTTRK